MATKRKRRTVERIEDWTRARYSVLPARAALDMRLTLSHARILMLIGRVNTEGGWCEFSQTSAADMFGMHRKTVNAAVSDLVKWRYLERLQQATTRGSFCHYRVNIDEPDDDVSDEDADGGVPPQDGTPPDEGVPPTDGTPPEKGGAASGRHGCPSGDGTGAASGRHSHNSERARRSQITDQTPPNPQGNEGEGDLFDDQSMQPDNAEISGWAKGWTEAAQREIADLFTNPIAGHVAKDFLRHVVGTLNPPHQADASAYVRQLRHKLQPIPGDVLRKLAERLIETRSRDLPATAQLVDQANDLKRAAEAQAKREEIVGAYPTQRRYVIDRNKVQWKPWMDHLRALGRADEAARADAVGAITVTHKLPQPAAELVAIGEVRS